MTFEELHKVLLDRKKSLPEGSTTTQLMTKGFSSILPKLNEESFEVGLALEFQKNDDVALEVSQCFYYILCLSVFIDAPYTSLNLSESNDELTNDKHELAKMIARCSADICHTPCLTTLNQLPPLLFQALKLGECSIDQMFKYL